MKVFKRIQLVNCKGPSNTLLDIFVESGSFLNNIQRLYSTFLNFARDFCFGTKRILKAPNQVIFYV